LKISPKSKIKKTQPSMTIKESIRELKGLRIGVSAKDKQDAIRIAQGKLWWHACQNKTHPVRSMDKFWFVVADGWNSRTPEVIS